MKNNLENAFKDKLSEFEAPYDPQAWEAVKNKLDAKSSGGGSSSTWKWIAASAAIATVVITSIVVFSSNENKISSTEIPATQAEANTEKDIVENSKNNVEIEGEILNSDDEIIDKVIPTDEEASNNITENLSEDNSDDLSERSSVEEKNDSKNKIEENSVENQIENERVNNVQQSATPEKFNYILGNVSTNEVCLGEQISITNSGAKNDIIRFEVDGKMKELKKAQTFTHTPLTSTVINFKDKNNNIIDSEYIRVNELPNPDFSIESNIFEGGLPVTICESFGEYKSVDWKFENNTTKQGSKVKYHFFEKGTYPITLKVTDFNGCQNTKEKEVRIENQYNLMAVDAFKPNGSDHRNKAFMPFSLTQRDVSFTLTIIDPRDNGVIFTSKDVSNPWTGKDERTGEMTDSETVFIWKVQIDNPLPNERPVYAGTVVHN